MLFTAAHDGRDWSRAVLAVVVIGALGLPFVPLLSVFGLGFPSLFLWDEQRLFQAILLCAGLLATVFGLWRQPCTVAVSRRLALVWLLVATISLCSCLMARYPLIALLDWLWMNGLAALSLRLGQVLRSGDVSGPRRWGFAFLFVAVSYLLWFIAGNAEAVLFYDVGLTDLNFPGFNNLRYFSDFQAIFLFFLPFAIRLYFPAGRLKFAAWLLVGLLFMLAFLNGGRSVFAGQICAHAALLMFGRGRYWPLFKACMCGWLIGALLYLGVTGFSEILNEVGNFRTGDSGRIELIRKGERLLELSPLIGHGGRHYGCFVDAGFDLRKHKGVEAAHPHNALVQLGVEWGGVVALLLVAWVAWLAFALLGEARRWEADTDGMNFAALGAFLSLTVHSMVAGVLNAPATQMQLVLLMAWGMSRCSVLWRCEVLARKEWWQGAVAVLLAGGIAVLFAIEFNGLPQRGEVDNLVRKEVPNLSPRFWQQGWLLPLCGRI